MQTNDQREELNRQYSSISVGGEPVEIVHGHPLDSSYDRVMPVFDDESVYVANRTAELGSGNVLDIGTGSGILAIAAAKRGCSVVGTDINDLAIQYATESAELSRVRERCQFLPGDMYEPVIGRFFDTIIANPPFVPLPYGFRFYRSADGGPDGLGIVRGVLEGTANHLSKHGTLFLLTMSLGNDQEPLVYRYLRDTFRHREKRIATTHIYETRNIDAEPFFSLFASVPAYTEWRRFLEKGKLTHLYYMFHKIQPNSRFEHVEEQNTIPLEQTGLSGSWTARVNRFRAWFTKKGVTEGAQRVAELSSRAENRIEKRDRMNRAETTTAAERRPMSMSQSLIDY